MQWGRWTHWRISELLSVGNFIMRKKYSLRALDEIFKSCAWVIFLISTILICFEKCFCTLGKTNENITDNTCTTFSNILVIFILNSRKHKVSFLKMFFFWYCYSIINFDFLILASSSSVEIDNTSTKLKNKDGGNPWCDVNVPTEWYLYSVVRNVTTKLSLLAISHYGEF